MPKLKFLQEMNFKNFKIECYFLFSVYIHIIMVQIWRKKRFY